MVLLILSMLGIQPAAAQSGASNTVFLPLIKRTAGTVMTGPGTWPMAAGNPERTSWTSTEVKGKLKAEWFTHFDAYISQKVQVIAAANKLFIAAADGLHALDSNSGDELWMFPTSLPPGNAPTYDNGVLYLGGLDRKMYAINAANGQQIWSYTAESGFATNPLVVDNLVLAGNRDGYFYAIHATGGQAGRLAWRYKTDDAILFSAAYKDGAIYFASQDMYAYALNLSGGLIWKSGKLPGAGFHSYWPVVYKDYVVFSGSWAYRGIPPLGDATFKILDREAYPSNAQGGDLIGPTGNVPGDWAPGTLTLNAARISEYFEAKPHRRTTVVLSRANGAEFSYDSDGDGRREYAPFLYLGTNSGNRYPPAVGPDQVLYQANDYIYNSSIPRGQVTGWKFGTNIISIPTDNTNAVDEPMAYSIGGSTVYWKRCCDRNAGSFSLTVRQNDNFFDEGGRRLRRTIPELFAHGWEFAAWKHGDQAAPVPYNGRVYMILNNAVVAFSPQGLDPVMPADEPEGSNTGVEPSTLERGTQLTGLNTKVTAGGTSWPLLYQQETYFAVREEYEERGTHFRMLEVAAGSSNPTSVQVSHSVYASALVHNFSGGTLTTRTSNRAPAVLFQNTSTQYQLRGSLAGMAYSTASGVQVRTSGVTVDGSTLNASWLLLWDATSQHRWMPMVISLQNRPTSIVFSGTGVTLSYPGAAGNLAVTPLYGMSKPKSSEETAWRSAIPSATVDRIRLLNRVARVFPVNGTETPLVSGGDVQITYAYTTYVNTPDWASDPNDNPLQLAYLPTQVALAAWNGSPIRINGQTFEQITDLGFLTPIGRAAGVQGTTSVTVTFPGMANTWKNAYPNPPAPSGNDPLQARLVAEIDKILQAGHLLPGYGKNGSWEFKSNYRLGHNLSDYWHNPAETVYTLTRALPLLPAARQASVRSYINAEMAAFPTFSISHVGWQTGATREQFPFPPEVDAARADYEPCDTCSPHGFTPENHYASWMYASKVNSSNTAAIHNATAAWVNPSSMPQLRQSLTYNLNSQIAGYIGYIRLASMSGVAPKAGTESNLINMLILRAAVSKYPSALQQTGFEYAGYQWAMRTYAPNMPDTLFVVRTQGTLWSQMRLYGFQMDRIYGLYGPGTGGAYAFGIDYINLVPELATFMRNYTQKEDRDAVADYERRLPYWFVADSEEGAGETSLRPIYDTISLFAAKAQILGARRAELEPYLDVPAVRVGDLYYIQKLILTLSAGN